MPRISVVIPAYNAQAHVADTVHSALAQRGVDAEVCVINDGSTDGTAAVLDALSAEGQQVHQAHPARQANVRLRVVHQANAGMSASRNRGIADSDSEFIALLDADDLWHPDKLLHQWQALRARPDAGVAYTGFSPWWGQDASAWLQEHRQADIDDAHSGWIYHQLILENWALPSSLLIRRSAWDELGPFLCEDQQTDDWEYLVRAASRYPFLKLAEDYVLYRQHPSSLSKRMPERNVGEAMRERLLRTHGYASPNGVAVDVKALAWQRFRGWRNFADGHCARGNLALGLKTFAGLLWRGPHRDQALWSLLLSLRRRLMPLPNPSTIAPGDALRERQR